jgi:hypothetical protein
MKADPLSTVYRVPRAVLDGSRAFLHERGLESCEGTALWIGRATEWGDEVDILRVFVPEQECLKTPDGVAVRLTEEAHYTLTDNLREGELFYCRIHSHPSKAYHSDLDDANAVITHQGAVSIVVPYFARAPLRLEDCAVHHLEHGRGWLPLTRAEVLRRFEVVP